MKKIVNDVVVEMTAEEIEEMRKHREDMPDSESTLEERLTALEQAGLERDAALMELASMLAGGV